MEEKKQDSPLKEAFRIISEHIRPVTFWTLDLVDSAKMRRRAPLDTSFLNFELFLAEILNENGAKMVEHVEGDRTIVYFDSADQAIEASLKVIESLPEFNRDRNRNYLGLPFRVRIGINTGKVLIDPSARLVEQKHPVFDLAGHLVSIKAKRPSLVIIGEETFQSLSENYKDKFSQFKRIDEIMTYFLLGYKEEGGNWLSEIFEKFKLERRFRRVSIGIGIGILFIFLLFSLVLPNLFKKFPVVAEPKKEIIEPKRISLSDSMIQKPPKKEVKKVVKKKAPKKKQRKFLIFRW